MDRNSGIKQRREERIEQLMAGKHTDSFSNMPKEKFSAVTPAFQPAAKNLVRDPEMEWRSERERWKSSFGESNRPSFFASFGRRLFTASIMFGLIWGIFHWDIPYAGQVRIFVADALNKDMDFASAGSWYHSHFGGAPSFLPVLGTKEHDDQKIDASRKLSPPMLGSIVQPFSISLKGIEIVPTGSDAKLTNVRSIDTGRVLEISENSQSGVTVVIRHMNGVTAVYGRLAQTKLKTNDWVQEGDNIGQLALPSDKEAGTLYLAVKKGDSYVDPAEVISLD